MLRKLSFYIISFAIVLCSVKHVSANFWDGIPVVSQAKSAVKLIAGDKEGAKKTHENFLNQAPVISQIKSLRHVIHGNAEAALKTQEQFFGETIEPVVDHFNTWLRLGLRGNKRNNPMPASAVEHFQRNFNMTEIYVKILEPIDFIYVNHMVGNENCYICTLAALKNKTVTNLVQEMEIGPIAQDDIISQVVNLYKRAGFQFAATVFNGSIVDFENYSIRNVGNGECAKFTLAFRKSSSSGCSDHYQIVYARIFRLEDGKVRYLITDFRELPFAKQRFLTSLPENSCEFNIISPWEKNQLSDLDDKTHPFRDRSNQLFGMS